MKRPVNHLRFSGYTCDFPGFGNTNTCRKIEYNQDKSQKKATQHDTHLKFLRTAHSSASAGNRVKNHKNSHENIGHKQIPSENGTKNNTWRQNTDSGGHTPLNQKQQGCKRSYPDIEALFEVFIGRGDPQFVIHRQHKPGEEKHGDRHTEVKLHELHPVGKGLAGCTEECDGTGLRGHDTQADCPPRQIALAGEEIIAVVHSIPAFPDAIQNNQAQCADENNPVE